MAELPPVAGDEAVGGAGEGRHQSGEPRERRMRQRLKEWRKRRSPRAARTISADDMYGAQALPLIKVREQRSAARGLDADWLQDACTVTIERPDHRPPAEAALCVVEQDHPAMFAAVSW